MQDLSVGCFAMMCRRPVFPLRQVIARALGPMGLSAIVLLMSGCGEDGRPVPEERPAPVEVVEVEVGLIEDIRQLSGSLRAQSDFTVSAKVSGRVERVAMDIGSAVERGELLGQLDAEPYALEVRKASAQFSVAEANRRAAEARADLAARELERRRQLEERGFLSDNQYEEALAQSVSATASLEVAEAELERAKAGLESAQVELGYCEIRAEWSGGSDKRFVAERFIDEGDRVGVGDPLFRMVSLDPLLAEVFVTEADYSRLAIGDKVVLRTDAYPDRSFLAEVARVAPVFSERSRQVRVELHVPNGEHLLRPGMFVRARLTLESKSEARIVPEEALVRREGGNGVFLVEEGSNLARWVPVRTGILQAGRLEIREPHLAGSVVVLGQQLIRDGSPVIVREQTVSSDRR